MYVNCFESFESGFELYTKKECQIYLCFENRRWLRVPVRRRRPAGSAATASTLMVLVGEESSFVELRSLSFYLEREWFDVYKFWFTVFHFYTSSFN